MNKNQIENLVHLMVAKIALELLNIFKNEDCFGVIENFSNSRTFANLFNFDTELWHESPNYIIECYLEEIGENELLRKIRGEKNE